MQARMALCRETGSWPHNFKYTWTHICSRLKKVQRAYIYLHQHWWSPVWKKLNKCMFILMYSLASMLLWCRGVRRQLHIVLMYMPFIFLSKRRYSKLSNILQKSKIVLVILLMIIHINNDCLYTITIDRFKLHMHWHATLVKIIIW